jgi:hypothetical protein
MRFTAQTLRRTLYAHRGTLILLAVLAVIWLVLRTTGAAFASTQEFEERINAGQPIVVEVFSNT